MLSSLSRLEDRRRPLGVLRLHAACLPQKRVFFRPSGGGLQGGRSSGGSRYPFLPPTGTVRTQPNAWNAWGAQAAGEEYLMECALLPFSRDAVPTDEPAHAKLSYSVPDPFSGRGLKLLLDPLQTEGEGLRTARIFRIASGCGRPGPRLLAFSPHPDLLSACPLFSSVRIFEGRGWEHRFLGFLFPALAKAGFFPGSPCRSPPPTPPPLRCTEKQGSARRGNPVVLPLLM